MNKQIEIPQALRDDIIVKEVKCADGVTRTKLIDAETGKPVIIRQPPKPTMANIFRQWLAGHVRRTRDMHKRYKLRVVPDDAGAPELAREDLDTDLGKSPARTRKQKACRRRLKRI